MLYIRMDIQKTIRLNTFLPHLLGDEQKEHADPKHPTNRAWVNHRPGPRADWCGSNNSGGGK
jgi:hypothetical protein